MSVPREVAELPADPGLEGDAAEVFRDRRRRIGSRYRRWRENFSSVRVLMDTEAERATALAGSYCTEAEAVVVAWVDTRAEAAGGRVDPSRVAEHRRWIDGFLGDWRAAVAEETADREWGREAQEQFDAAMAELLERARDRGEEHLEERAEARPGRWSRLAATLLGGLRRLVERLFRPDRPDGGR